MASVITPSTRRIAKGQKVYVHHAGGAVHKGTVQHGYDGDLDWFAVRYRDAVGRPVAAFHRNMITLRNR